MGGLYFSINVLINFVSCWIAAYLYVASSEGRDNAIDSFIIYSSLGAFIGIWFLSTALYFYLIKRPYWKTFYSTQTGAQNTMDYFLKSDDDATRAFVFLDSIDLWKDIEPDVKVWCLANWGRWVIEKPVWFTPAFKASVPDYMIPGAELKELNEEAMGSQREKRKSSLNLVVKRLSLNGGAA